MPLRFCFLFYSYLNANIWFPRFWAAQARPCFCSMGRQGPGKSSHLLFTFSFHCSYITPPTFAFAFLFFCFVLFFCFILICMRTFASPASFAFELHPCFCVGCSRIVSARQQPRQKGKSWLRASVGLYSYLNANICFPRFLRFWASPLLLRRLQPHRKCAAATKAKGFLFYSYLHANICFPRFWLARMKACPCFCAAGKRAKVHFVLIFSLCLEAPFAFHFANAKEAQRSNKNKKMHKSK